MKVTVDEAATETLVAKLGRRKIAKKTVKFTSAGTKTVRLKLNRKGRRALRKRRRARVSVRATGVDAAGILSILRRLSGLPGRSVDVDRGAHGSDVAGPQQVHGRVGHAHAAVRRRVGGDAARPVQGDP